MPKTIKVGVITQAEGAHLPDYFGSLAKIEEAEEELPLEWYSSKDAKEPKVERFEYPKGERGYLPFLRSAVRAAAGLEEPPISAEEGLHVLRSIFAFYEGAKSGRVQTVE